MRLLGDIPAKRWLMLLLIGFGCAVLGVAALVSYPAAGMVLLAGLGLALGVSLLHQRSISKSIIALAEVAERVGQTKDFAIRAPLSSPAELEQLVRGFNGMLARMEEHEQGMRNSEERFRQVAETIREVFWITDVAKSRLVYISPGYEIIWGRSCASLYERPGAWMDAVHTADRARVAQAASTRQHSGDYNEIYRIVRPDGITRWIQDRAFPIRDSVGVVYRVAGIAEDITERKTAELRLAAQHKVVEALAESATLAEAAHKILGAVCEGLDWELGAIWELDPATNALDCIELWCSPSVQAAGLDRVTWQSGWGLDGFPSRVRTARKAIWAADLMADPRLAQAVAGRMGLHAGLGVPIILGMDVIGVIELYSRQIRESQPPMLELMSALGSQIGQFMARTRAEEAVREAEAKYRDIYENAAEGIFQTTPDGRYLSANPALARILGYDSPSDLIHAVTDIGAQLCVDPQSRGRLKQRLEAAGSVRGFENQIFRKDGTVIWTSVNVRVVRDPDGKVLYYEGTSEDITARKEAELQLAMLAHAVESTGEMICITDLEDRFIFANRAFQQAYGYTEAEILGKTPAVLFGASNRAGLIEEILAQSRAGGWRGEVVDRRKDGSEFPVFLSTSKLKDSSGRTIGLMGVAQDITERKRAEEQIRLLADAVHSAHEMISITDEQNRFTFVNQAFLNAYGYSEAEILGRKPEFLYSSRNPPGLCDRVFAETLNGFWSGEILNCRKDRSEFPIALSTSPIRTARGVLLGLVGVARDITERKRAEKQTTAFSWLGYRLSAATTPLQAAEIIMRVASELFGWDAGYFHLYDQAIDELVPVLTMDTVDGERMPVSSATFTRDPSPLMREVMQQGARLVNRPTEAASLHQLVPFGNTARRSESMMYVPIHSSGTVLGILSIQSYLPRAYSEADLMLLQALADQCGGALQRLRVTEALRESELRFRALFESAPIGIALHDLAGGFVHVNAAYQSMVGYSREELRQVNVSQITHPEDVAEARSLFDGLRDGKSEGYHREKRYLRKDGQVVWGQTSASAIRNTEGGLVYIISMVEDITERKKVVRALEESERKLRLIAENTRDVIFAFDLERRPAYVNPAVAELTGYTFAELQQRSFLDWVHPEDRQRMEQQWADLYAGESQSEVEFRVVTREGETKWCSSSWGPLLDEAGRQIGVQGHVRDVSERKQLEREVVESTANERRRIGHELHDGLGQYLAGIAFRAKAFEQSLGAVGAPFDSEAHELVSLISNAISQSRSLARGLDPVDVETIGLPAALQNLATETRKFFDVGCQFKCPDTRLALDSPTALSLYRIVQEAIHNAIRHGEARQIEIGLETAAGQLALRVQDDGVGFEVGSAPESGMGLRVMQYRARSIGGSLKILSQRSQGTQICCEVPLRGERL